MTPFIFDSKETEEYYNKMRRTLGGCHPSNWNHSTCITREDVENYVKDANNILAC